MTNKKDSIPDLDLSSDIEEPKSMSSKKPSIETQPIGYSPTAAGKEIGILKQDVKNIKDFLVHFEQRMDSFNELRMNEVFRSIDIWNSDVSYELNKSNKISSILSEFLEQETRMRANCTSDEYIEQMKSMFIVMRDFISSVNNVLIDKMKHADDVKRKLMTIYEKA